MAEISYRRHRFPPAVIQHSVWLYLRFTLSYGDVEDLLAERGLDSSYETVRSLHHRADRERPRDMHGKRGGFIIRRPHRQLPTDETTGDDGADLTGCRRHGKRKYRRSYREGRPLPIGAQATGHAPDRLGDDGNSHDFEAMQPGHCGMSPNSATPYP